MLEKLANKISQESGKDYQIILYGLEVLVNFILGYLLLISTALIFGWLKISLAAAITASVLRIFTGGKHAKTSTRCIIHVAIIFNVIALLARLFVGFFTNTVIFYLLIAVILITVIIAISVVPVDVPQKPIYNKKQKLILKTATLIFAFLWFFLLKNNIYNFSREIVLASILGYIWQIVTLFNFFNKGDVEI